MRQKLLEFIRIIEEKSDEEHPISTQQFIKEFENNGIDCDRKTVARNMELLIDEGYDIIETRGREKSYYLGSRDFDEVEIRLLTDAVLAASFITERKSEVLVKKLLGLVSEYQAKTINRRIFIRNRVKSDNEYIYYGIGFINEAIENSRRIIITYNGDKTFEISPYAMAWNKDKFYLIGNNAAYDNLVHLRLDRINNVTPTDIPSRHFSEVCEYKDTFDSADYIARHINMFGGEPQVIELYCTKKGLELFSDEFGADAFVTKSGDGFSVRFKAATGRGMVCFLALCGDEITVKSPQSLISDLRRHLDKINALYEHKK